MNVDRDSGMGVIGPHHHPSPMPLNPPQARNSREAASFNHALQRTPGFGVQLPRAAVVRPAHSRAPGPESLSLGSLGILAPL
jgi:hypothetical protein